MMKYDLTVIGDINLDLLLQVPRFPVLDDEVEVTRYQRLPGGDAANVATAAARLGLQPAILASVGNDAEGDLLVQALNRAGVNTDLVTRQNEMQTGLVVSVVRGDGQRNLLAHRGANSLRQIEPQQVNSLSCTAAIHISDPLPDEVSKLAGILAQVKPARTSLDPGTITAQRGVNALRPLLKKIKICFLNQAELHLLTGLEDLQPSLDVLLACGPEIVVIKLGPQGCLVASSTERVSIPSFPVQVVDSTGAGDAFDAGFLYALQNEMSLRDAGRFANAVGALTTRALGAQSSQPDLPEVDRLIKGEDR